MSEIERILVTGCGRSGSAYTAKLFTVLDLACGHEQVFSLPAVVKGEVDWPAGRPAESSWLAAPFLAQLPPGTAIVHQVRSPLAVIRSLVRVELFSKPGAFRDFALAHMRSGSELAQVPPLEACLRYWDEWNELVETGARESGQLYRRVRLEQLQPSYLSQLLLELGQLRGADEISDRMRLVRPDSNTRGDKSRDDELTWESLPDCDAKRAVEARAREYGLGLEAPVGRGVS